MEAKQIAITHTYDPRKKGARSGGLPLSFLVHMPNVLSVLVFTDQAALQIYKH